MLSPSQIINERMMINDFFSQWLGIEVLLIEKGACKLQMKVTEQMVNGFNIAHGGITYSFSDTALAFASNSYGVKAVSIETSISHHKPLMINDVITAVCSEISRTNRVGVYEVDVRNQHNVLVSSFKGTVFITDKFWE